MKYLTPLFLFIAITVPNFVFAVEDPAPDGLVTCTDGGLCDWCDFVAMIQLINIWLIVIVGLIAVILFMYAGYRITSSRGEVGVVTEGRKMIGNVAIGLFILILATTIVDVILQTATGKDFGVWSSPTECGESFGVTGADPVGVGLGKHDGVTVSPDPNAGQPGFDENGFISAPPTDPNAGQPGFDENGFISAPVVDPNTGEGSSDAARNYIQYGN